MKPAWTVQFSQRDSVAIGMVVLVVFSSGSG